MPVRRRGAAALVCGSSGSTSRRGAQRPGALRGRSSGAQAQEQNINKASANAPARQTLAHFLPSHGNQQPVNQSEEGFVSGINLVSTPNRPHYTRTGDENEDTVGVWMAAPVEQAHL